MSETYRPITFKEPFTTAERERIYGGSRIRLLQSADGEPGRNYLCRRRQLDVGTIAKFRLGYVPLGIGHPFAGRIVMPILDAYARVLALSVRPIWDRQCGSCYKLSLNSQLGPNESCPHCKAIEVPKVQPKYWNEPFAKKQHLHGLWLAKYEIARTGTAIIVEGQMDVMTLHAHGFANAVGVLGGAFSIFHALLLKRWAKQIVILFDADKAGGKHSDKAEKALDIIRSGPAHFNGAKATSLRLPDGDDPDSFLMRNGAGDMRSRINDAMMEAGMTRIDNA